jgi:hypothetical protein
MAILERPMARKTWIAGIAVLTACFFALLLMILMNHRADALITATAGEVHKQPPPASVKLGDHEHADSGTGSGPFGVHAFEEEQDYVTKAPIVLDVCTTNTSAFVTCPNPRSGNIDRTSALSPGTIPVGTCIDSHFLHADPPGSTGPVRTYGGLTGTTSRSTRRSSV